MTERDNPLFTFLTKEEIDEVMYPKTYKMFGIYDIKPYATKEEYLEAKYNEDF
jgi:hypothetical protein